MLVHPSLATHIYEMNERICYVECYFRKFSLPPKTRNFRSRKKNDFLIKNPFFYSHGWYRGGISRTNAQKKLQGQPDGSFLLRNSQTSGTHFTLSFRSAGITLHYRIQYDNGFWLVDPF